MVRLLCVYEVQIMIPYGVSLVKRRSGAGYPMVASRPRG